MRPVTKDASEDYNPAIIGQLVKDNKLPELAKLFGRHIFNSVIQAAVLQHSSSYRSYMSDIIAVVGDNKEQSAIYFSRMFYFRVMKKDVSDFSEREATWLAERYGQAVTFRTKLVVQLMQGRPYGRASTDVFEQLRETPGFAVEVDDQALELLWPHLTQDERDGLHTARTEALNQMGLLSSGAPKRTRRLSGKLRAVNGLDVTQTRPKRVKRKNGIQAAAAASAAAAAAIMPESDDDTHLPGLHLAEGRLQLPANVFEDEEDFPVDRPQTVIPQQRVVTADTLNYYPLSRVYQRSESPIDYLNQMAKELNALVMDGDEVSLEKLTSLIDKADKVYNKNNTEAYIQALISYVQVYNTLVSFPEHIPGICELQVRASTSIMSVMLILRSPRFKLPKLLGSGYTKCQLRRMNIYPEGDLTGASAPPESAPDFQPDIWKYLYHLAGYSNLDRYIYDAGFKDQDRYLLVGFHMVTNFNALMTELSFNQSIPQCEGGLLINLLDNTLNVMNTALSVACVRGNEQALQEIYPAICLAASQKAKFVMQQCTLEEGEPALSMLGKISAVTRAYCEINNLHKRVIPSEHRDYDVYRDMTKAVYTLSQVLTQLLSQINDALVEALNDSQLRELILLMRDLAVHLSSQRVVPEELLKGFTCAYKLVMKKHSDISLSEEESASVEVSFLTFIDHRTGRSNYELVRTAVEMCEDPKVAEAAMPGIIAAIQAAVSLQQDHALSHATNGAVLMPAAAAAAVNIVSVNTEETQAAAILTDSASG